MRRFMVVLLALSAVAVAACGPTSPGSSASVQRVGPVNVHVFCDDAKGPGIGARINPWRVHTKGAVQLRFNIRPTPGNQTVSAMLEPVDPNQWPFQDGSYGSLADSITAQVDTAKLGTYQYKLTITCPNDVIVIDPIVIVDE